MEPYTFILKSFAEGHSLIAQYSKALEQRDWEAMAFMAKNWDELIKMIGVYEHMKHIV